MTQLIIILPLELPQASSASSQVDYVLSPDGRAVASHSRAAMALLPQPGHAEVVAVVPAQALSWHEVQLPKGLLTKGFLSESGSPRLRAVLEGLLEERVLDDPSQLHFALAPNAREGASVWVAACDRTWLRGWLQALEANRHTVSRIVPEFAPADSQLNGAGNSAGIDGEAALETLHVIGTPQQAHMVFAPMNTASGSTQPAALSVLPLSADSVHLANWPEASPVVAEPAVAALAESLFKRRVDLQQNTLRWLQASQSSWDLAQFELQNNSRSRSWKRATTLFGSLLRAPRWRAARWATAALLIINLAGLNAWAWSERNSVQSKRAAIKEVLTSTFPQVKVVVDAPAQMARELAVLRQAAGGTSNSDFDSLLNSVGSLGASTTTPSAIDYATGEIRVKGLGLSPEQISQTADQLKRQGLSASLQADTLVVTAKAAP